MGEPLRCADARELAAEVALGVATAQDRARLLTHVATCGGCRTLLAELSEVIDDVVALAPVHEPPAGFESKVLARLNNGRDRLGGLRRMALRVAALVVVAGLSGGAVYWAHGPDRELAAQVRSTLATASGQYFTAVPLQDVVGTRRGSLFAYQGQPAWLFLTVRGPVAPGRYTVEITDRHGVRYLLATGIDLSQKLAWGGTIPVTVHEISVVRVTESERLVFSAQLATS